MKSVKKTWQFSFGDDALYWLERLPVTEMVEGEEFTLLSGPGNAETRVAKRIIRAALRERLAREGKIFASGTGVYEEGGTITFKLDPPGAESS
jgi:hypothetical protein